MEENISDNKEFEGVETPVLENLSVYHICGTQSGYQKHLRNRTPTCRPCKDANTKKRKEWGEKNRERHNQISNTWVKNNPDKHRRHMSNVMRRRRAKKFLVETEKYTQEQIVELYGAVCHFCQKDIDLEAPRHPVMGGTWKDGLQLDHLIPISKGGNDTIDNIRPIHVICNMKKGNRTDEV
jgi:5-methylcytosine-specific restriction endonuclease McrA